MNVLRLWTRGAQVELLQLALTRAGFPTAADGVFGPLTVSALRRFQTAAGLNPDGVAGPGTHAALRPWYTGYLLHTVQAGESLYRLALRYNSSLRAIETANPELDPLNLSPGQRVTVPLGFAVVPTDIRWCSDLVDFCCEGLAARYPFLRSDILGESGEGRPLRLLRLGSGENRVLYNACHHANEWITVPLLLRFTEELCAAAAYGEELAGESAAGLLAAAELALVPCLNPDGMDLVTGALFSAPALARAAAIAALYPEIPFPEGWKANLGGVDLNLQYPAGWENARAIKFAQGFIGPAPRDYVGEAPLTAPESLALYRFTQAFSPGLTLSYHSQGEVIYWKFLDYAPPASADIVLDFARVSGYTPERTPDLSGFAGYKDWFLQDFGSPGFTIEVGQGENPLPLSQFERIYRENLGILVLGLTATAESSPGGETD